MTVGYQNRSSRGYGGSGVGSLSRDLPSVPKILLANKFLLENCFSIGSKAYVYYSPGEIIIKLTNQTL
ncbi:hypothetical protein A2823_02495 [Candidatus Nomurabacteria bacterium RIFCSPHIGHO2_01_FULL_41_91]|nr:MAG: hypothetical protein A2823_02495 [Candidatus Nomurabacteria bacterium RIFCSPHIGHO2_01_FULL_41_91]OGI80426.1 MAG: hypothetical protein A3D43_00115 [Candidatus Nomurabacteria bacterium RIFCSPHIGHO2_02_FULL_41_52]